MSTVAIDTTRVTTASTAMTTATATASTFTPLHPDSYSHSPLWDSLRQMEFDPLLLPQTNFPTQIIARAREYARLSDCRTSIHVAVVFQAGKRHKPLAFGYNSIIGGKGSQPSQHAEMAALEQYYSLQRSKVRQCEQPA